jgi:hypothetical protein
VGSKKPRTGHLVEDLFFEDVIVVEIDGQISAKFRSSSVVVVAVYSAEDTFGKVGSHGPKTDLW